MPLVQLDPFRQPGQLVTAGLGEIPLDTQVPEQRRGTAQRQRHVPPGLVGERRGHVRPEVFRRDQLPGPALDGLPGQRVSHVRRPDPLDPLQDGQVDPAATGRARLPLHARMRLAQPVQQRAGGQRLPVRGRGTGPHPGAGVDDVPVAVPLDIGDRVFRQQPADPAEQVVRDLGPGQVQDELVALQRRYPPAGRQDPLRVRPVQGRVRVHHLRLEPQAELHAAGPHVVRDPVQPAGPDRLVHRPVTQPGPVAAAAGEPAVVQHVAFHPDARGQVGQLGQRAEIVPEVDRFPDVQVHRPR